MFRKYENFLKPKEKNIFNVVKVKNENSFNKYNVIKKLKYIYINNIL